MVTWELIATIIFQSSSGGQQGSSSPTFKINHTGISEATCSQRYDRSISASNQIGTVKAYVDCGNMSKGSVHEFNIYVDVSGGETLEIMNVSLMGFEEEKVNISISNTPPIVAITVPEENSIVSGTIDINWTTTDLQNDRYVTNITMNNGTDTFFLASVLSDTISNFTFNTSTLINGSYNLTITSTENSTSDLFFGIDTHQNITIGNPVDVDAEYPIFSNETVETANNSEYGYNREYKFNVTITSTNGSIVFQIAGNNYTATNLTANNYNITIIGLSAGNYIYNWSGYGNGTDAIFNTSINRDYTIALNITLQGSISGNLTGEYPIETTITGSESNLGDDDSVYTLYRDNVATSNPDVQTLQVGIYSYIFNTSGNINYSNALLDTKATNITINNSLILGISGTTPITYGVTSDIAGNGCPTQLTCSLDNSNIVYGVGTHFFNYSTTGNLNYSASSINFSLIVQQNTSIVRLWINGSRANTKVEEGTILSLFGDTITGEGNISLYRNSSLINSSLGSVNQSINFTAVGYHNITIIHPNTQNFTISSETWFVNVTEVPTDTTPPVFDNLRNFTHTVNTSFSQSITATDETSSVSYKLNQTNQFNINVNTGLIINVTQLNTLTIYYLNLTANDTSGNQVSGIFFINVTSAPIITFNDIIRLYPNEVDTIPHFKEGRNLIFT